MKMKMKMYKDRGMVGEAGLVTVPKQDNGKQGGKDGYVSIREPWHKVK